MLWLAEGAIAREWQGHGAFDAPLIPCLPAAKIERTIGRYWAPLVQARFMSASDIWGLLVFCFAMQSFHCALLSLLPVE
jgi:hypothetical protein